MRPGDSDERDSGDVMLRPSLMLAAAALLAACAVITRPAPPNTLSPVDARITGFSDNVRFLNPDHDTFVVNLREGMKRARAAATDGTLDILALSGGGAGGGFGAGVMKGLTQSGKRPSYELVTGVSTGSLIGAFAFLGPDWDDELERAYTSGEAEALTSSLGFGSLFRAGLLGGANLRNLVTGFVTPEMVAAVAGESAKGRTFLVATTNLDAEEPVYWDMGVVASRGGEEARKLFIDILIASSSIPGAFPPVLIPVVNGEKSYSEVHVDGGVTVPFFVFPEVAYLSEERFPELAGANISVVIDGQLESVNNPSKVSLIAITLRAFNIGLIRMARSELFLTSALAQRHRMNAVFTYIPQSYPFSGPFNFKRDAMRQLFDYGAACAAAGQVWLGRDDMVARAGTPDLSRLGPGECPAAPILSPKPENAP